MKNLTISILALGLLGGLAGCQETTAPVAAQQEPHSEITLREGDVIKITFPGAPNLDTQPQPIRRDGKVTVGIVGEIAAAGLTPTELQNQLLAKLSDQLLTKEVVVTVLQSTFSVFVDGPVLRPGKIVADHPITIMEAIMESGGFDYERADTRNVSIIRHKGNSKDYTYFTLNLQLVLEGKQRDLFYLEPGDMVHVPQKFSWF